MKKIRKIISVLTACSVMSSNARSYKFPEIHWNRERTVALVTVGVVVITTVGVVGLAKLFSGKKDNPGDLDSKNFDKREQNWIKFLSGEKIEDKSFLFKSCEEFRSADNNSLENNHDFIQVVFPSLEKSGYANQDLYLNKNLKKWQDLMQDLGLRLKIQKNLKLNLNCILTFFGFEVTLGKDSEIIKLNANTDGVVFKPGDHNSLRLTRVLKSLKIFGLDREHQLIIDSINSNKDIMALVNSNANFKTSYDFWVESAKTARLF